MTSNIHNLGNEGTAVKLSYSSMKLLQSCEQRYSHYKIWNTQKDSDHVESESLGLGKAFHQVLEKTFHKSWDENLLSEAMAEHKVDVEERDLLSAMLTKYVEFRKLSGLTIINCEFSINTPEYVGYIDAIAIDPNSKLWWIIDLKTAGRHDPNLVPQLAKDMQIGLYSHFVPHLEAHLEKLSGYTFGGFKYNQTIKSKASSMSGLLKGVKVYEITIPKALIKEGEAYNYFKEVYMRAVELHNGESPRKNLGACFNYFQPCPYFSKCHGVEFTKGHESISVDTIETLTDKELL